MLVRRMTIEDIDAVVQIEQECFSQPWSAQSFMESLTREDTIFLVCEALSDESTLCQEGQEHLPEAVLENTSVIAGYMGLYLSFDEASITNVAVSPSYRKRGIGETLVSNAKQDALESGVSQMLLEVRVSNEAAISLYKKMNFEELGIRKRFYEHPVEDAYIMRCTLLPC